MSPRLSARPASRGDGPGRLWMGRASTLDGPLRVPKMSRSRLALSVSSMAEGPLLVWIMMANALVSCDEAELC